jgi:hypothetical protein
MEKIVKLVKLHEKNGRKNCQKMVEKFVKSCQKLLKSQKMAKSV